ncbi:unnamed protein product, partial [Musa hybrid cultivar]
SKQREKEKTIEGSLGVRVETMSVTEAGPAYLPLSRDFSTTHSVLHLLLRFDLLPLAAGVRCPPASGRGEWRKVLKISVDGSYIKAFKVYYMIQLLQLLTLMKIFNSFTCLQPSKYDELKPTDPSSSFSLQNEDAKFSKEAD